MTKTIIAGSRNCTDYNLLVEVIKTCSWGITSVVSGCANGVDYLGEVWARQNNLPIYRYAADWSNGRHAGYIRNVLMAENAEALIAIQINKSKGTQHMINIANEKGLLVHVVEYNV